MCTINLNINKTSRQLHRECFHKRVRKDFFKPDTETCLIIKELTEGYIKIKNLYTTKDIKKLKGQMTEQGTIFEIHIFDNGLISKMYFLKSYQFLKMTDHPFF